MRQKLFARLCVDCGATVTAPSRQNYMRCVGCRIRRSDERYRHIRSATARVHAAIKAGKLVSPRTLACADCGRAATEYDHRDYSKPLAVEPVCHPCNKRRGPGLMPPPAPKPKQETAAA